MKSTLWALAALLPLASAVSATADEVRYFEQDGITYRETRRTVRRPVTESRYETREETVYREHLTTDSVESYRTRHLPVTEYRLEAYWAGRWNPFRRPYLAYEYVPRTHWEPRTEVVRTPVSRRELVPERRVVQVPVTTTKMAEEEVITRVAVSGNASGDPFASSVARQGDTIRIGGVARLDNDPPRYGQTSDWRASSGSVRR